MSTTAVTPLEFEYEVGIVEQTHCSPDAEPTPPRDANTGSGEGRHPLMRAARTAAGVFLILFGILGCILPVIPGLPILAAGILLLGPNHWIVRRGRTWVQQKRAQADASPRVRRIREWFQKKKGTGPAQ